MIDEDVITSAAAEIIRICEKKEKLSGLAWKTLELIELLESQVEKDGINLSPEILQLKARIKVEFDKLNISNDLPF